MINIRKFLNGLNIIPRSDGSTAPTSQGDLAISSVDGKLYLHNGTVISPIITASSTDTLTNKSIDSSSNTLTNIVNANLSGSAAITNANLATMNTLTIKGNNTGSSSTPLDLTASQVNTILGLSTAAVSIGALDAQSENAQGLALVSGVLTAQSADATHPGVVNNTTQTFSGQKTFSTGLTGTLTGNATNVTGVVALINGGTGTAAASANAAFNALSPMTTSGDLIIGGTSGAANRLGATTDGFVLTLSSGNPVWAAASGGTAPTSIGALDGQSANANGLTILSNVLYTQSANTTHPGMINTTTQSVVGAKTFITSIGTPSLLDNGSGLTIQTSSNQNLIFETQGSGRSKFATDGIDLGQTTGPSSPVSGYNSLYFKSDDKLYSKNSSGVEHQIGSGSGGINYIENSDAESGTQGWVLYKDAAGPLPVDGTGGSPTVVSINRRTTTTGDGVILPLRGIASFELSTTAANSQGEGVSCNFTIDQQDCNKVLSISFDWAPGPTFVTDDNISDLRVYIYDITNSKLITPSQTSLSNPGTFQATFNSTTSTSYRLIFHSAVADSISWALYFDTVTVGPQLPLFGPAMSDWADETSQFTSTSIGTFTSDSKILTKRIGDNLWVRGTLVSNAGGSSATLGLSLPSKYVINSTKLPNLTNQSYLGFGWIADGSTNAIYSSSGQYSLVAFYDGSDTGSVYFASALNGSKQLAKITTTFATNEPLVFEFQIPISGWSTNVVSANDKVYNISNYLVNGTRVTGSAPASLGQYRSYLRNGGARTFTETNGNPTTTPTSTDGIKLYGNVSWASGDTSNQPSKYDIYVGKGKTVNLQAYLSTGRTGNVDIKPLQLGSTEAQGYNWSYDPTTGIVAIAPYYGTGSEVAHYYGGDANASQVTSPIYFDLIVSDNVFTVQSGGPRSEVWLRGTNGHGSTNAYVRKFLTTLSITGSAITYVPDVGSGLGDSFKINEDGIYAITYTDANNSTQMDLAITLNATGGDLQTQPASYSTQNILLADTGSSNGGLGGCASVSKFLRAGDVIRAQDDGTGVDSGAYRRTFLITKINN